MKWLILLALLFLSACGFLLPEADAAGKPPSGSPGQDIASTAIAAAPAFLDSVGSLLWTIFLTGVILSFMSTKVRAAFAEAGVAFWIRIKYRIEKYRRTPPEEEEPWSE